MKLVAGLGNPGRDYAGTYHNVGFDALDVFAARFRAPEFRLDKKCNAEVSDFDVSGEKVLLVKPLTYMNLSGDAIGAISRYYKIAPRDILVFYDDIDIPVGTVRARESGSAGTHNGMRDIVAKLGTCDFARVRIGTGPKPNYMALADYVLSHYGESVRIALARACEAACDFAAEWLSGAAWQDKTVCVV